MARNTTHDLEKYGPWGLITGATEGIGAAMADKLAAAGLNVVLVARTKSKLDALAEDLEQRHGVETRVVVQDLSLDGAGTAVLEQVTDLDIGLLVSNAGRWSMGGFLQDDLDALRRTLLINTMTQMELSHGIGRQLVRRQRKGGIVLLSSTFAYSPVPMSANYAAAKSYALDFGEALHHELAEHGIDCTVLVPGPTRTPGLNVRDDFDASGLPLPQMNPADVADEGLRALRRGVAVHVPGTLNRLGSLTPRRVAITMWKVLLGRLMRPGLLASAQPAGLIESMAD